MDLFGDTVTTPQTVPARGLLNAAWGFTEFWKAWPSGPRKVAKQQCLNKWATLGCATEATLIAQHVEWMKTQEDWQKDGGRFICAPLVYLNQQRWLDWTPPPVVKKAPDALAIIKAHKGTAPPAEVREKMRKIITRQG